ncbi:type II toxin-antitoxin system VapC family toxin [Rhizobium mayense]|uniref:Ribonuclease VapC n=1 Tax=Rhizobium mayense TaxID=1312184 RepID=A0ABT7JMR5_9HYPH|nr:type II toxin-antitoxin system VapC family toxin [Rhizobium mayense]MDL2397644.1 type II toxin-antitoxin system VapC family toxin [Rhizobium mayense]
MYLLDTNVVSELRRVKPHGAVLAWINSVRSDDLAISSITIGEIQRGIELTGETDPQKAKELTRWLDSLQLGIRVISLDAPCMIQWAQFMHRKSPTLIADAMIAATASVHNLTIVTRDIGDFSTFPATVLNPFDYKSP